MWTASRNQRTKLNYWPAFLDVLTAVLMVFVLSTYLQIVLRIELPTHEEGDTEALRVLKQQAEFVAQLKTVLAEDIAQGNLELEQQLASIQIRFNEAVLFPRGDYKLNEAGRALLTRLGTFLASSYKPGGVRRIQVEGHTDDTPFPAYKARSYPANNWQLSSARATEVTLFLLGQQVGLSPGLFSATGYADYRPIARNSEASGRARNRRVEVELAFAAEPR